MITVCGKKTDRADVERVDVCRPKDAGGFWQGIPHRKLLNTMDDAVHARGWSVEHQRFAMSRDEADLAGGWQLKIPGIDPPEGMAFALGFLTSNARRRALKLVVGTNIFVCQNGLATGEIVMNRRHTSGIDLFGELDAALGMYEAKAVNIQEQVSGWEQRELSVAEADRLLIRTGEDGILPWSRVGKLCDEFRRPTFGDFAQPTSWGLMNAFTHVVKRQPPLQQMDAMAGFRGILPSAGDPILN